MKVYIILPAAVCIFFAKTYSISLGSDPFSSGKSCSANSDCNTALGVTCCGVGTNYGRCCPDSLCIMNCKASDSTTFDYCGSVCPDYPKTTQSTPSYLSTTKSTTTTATTTTASNATTTTSASTITTASNVTTITSASTTTTPNNATSTTSATTITTATTTTTPAGGNGL